MLCLLQSPCAAQIDDSQTLCDSLRNERPRNIVWRGQEEDIHTVILQKWPGEVLQWIAAVAGKNGRGLCQRGGAFDVTFATKEKWSVDVRVAQKKASQFHTGIA